MKSEVLCIKKWRIKLPILIHWVATKKVYFLITNNSPQLLTLFGKFLHRSFVMRFLFPMRMINEGILWWTNIISLGTGSCRGAGFVECRRHWRLYWWQPPVPTGVMGLAAWQPWAFFSIDNCNTWSPNPHRNTHYNIVYYLNEMFTKYDCTYFTPI